MLHVRCSECGFLAVRHTDTRQLMEAESSLRESGHIHRARHDHQSYDALPACFISKTKFNIPEEMGNPPVDDKRKDCLQRERDCNGFTPWIQGFTPREHQEMIQQAGILRQQKEEREFLSRREESDREERRRRDQEQRDFQLIQSAGEIERDRVARRHNVFSLLIALVSVVIAACAAINAK